MPLSSPLPPGFILENRYEILQCLGYGGFGRTYLASDRHRFDEQCVIKEFAPHVDGHSTLHKATELFQREAGVLYQLKHPQIPGFRALLTVSIQGEEAIFLVEQYIHGQSYAYWLHQGYLMNQEQALQLVLDLLPVLTYIHDRGVIHRDISPDNLICEQSTGKPALIDFGSVKQVAELATQLGRSPTASTQIRKIGYTPPEQLKGEAYPNSDLYALAITTLVMMTGRSPLEFYDDRRMVWQWERFIQLHPTFTAVLDRMLAQSPFDRFPSAESVRQALQPIAHLASTGGTPTQASPSPSLSPSVVTPPTRPPQPIPPSTARTLVVSPEWNPAPPPAPAPLAVPVRSTPNQAPLHQAPLQRSHPSSAPAPIPHTPGQHPLAAIGKGIGWLILAPFRLIGLVFELIWGVFRLVGWTITWVWRLVIIAVTLAIAAIALLFWQPDWGAALMNFNPMNFNPLANRSPKTCQEVIATVETLGVSPKQFYEQVNQRLYDKYPELKGRMLTDRPEDQKMREEWCTIAEQVLQKSQKSPKSSNGRTGVN